MNNFLSISFNICFGCSKELPQARRRLGRNSLPNLAHFSLFPTGGEVLMYMVDDMGLVARKHGG